MNFIDGTCNQCGIAMLVNTKEWADPFAHVCVICQANIAKLSEE